MKTIKELIRDLPVDHLIAAVLVLASLIFLALELRFDPRAEKDHENKKEIQYYVEPHKKDFHKITVIAIFLLLLIGITIAVIYTLDSVQVRRRG